MASSIVDIKNMGDALRNTGYKNIESAVAEIIDNAEEANAKNAFVILGEHIDPSSGRKVIHEIGFWMMVAEWIRLPSAHAWELASPQEPAGEDWEDLALDCPKHHCMHVLK